MLTCTFFGHRDTPKEIEPTLRSTLIDLIENKKVVKFYVGNHGNFDCMVKRCLVELKEIYSIDYYEVIAYLPVKNDSAAKINYSDTIIPNGIETVPKKFAISYCNKWMIAQSDYVVTYVKYSFGGAAQFQKLAERKKKAVINIAAFCTQTTAE